VVQGISTEMNTDYTVEQMMPLQAYGTQFAMLALPGQSNVRYKLMAMENDTLVNVGTELVLARGEFVEREVSGPAAFLSSTKPIMVVQIMQHLQSSDIGRPSIVIIPPMERALSKYTFSNRPDNPKPFTSHVMIIIDKEQQNGLVLDGSAVMTSAVDIPGSTPPLVGLLIAALSNQHVIEHVTGQSFVAYMYSYVPTSATCGTARNLGLCFGEVSTPERMMDKLGY
jgi:hypothetical protein